MVSWMAEPLCRILFFFLTYPEFPGWNGLRHLLQIYSRLVPEQACWISQGILSSYLPCSAVFFSIPLTHWCICACWEPCQVAVISIWRMQETWHSSCCLRFLLGHVTDPLCCSRQRKKTAWQQHSTMPVLSPAVKLWVGSLHAGRNIHWEWTDPTPTRWRWQPNSGWVLIMQTQCVCDVLHRNQTQKRKWLSSDCVCYFNSDISACLIGSVGTSLLSLIGFPDTLLVGCHLIGLLWVTHLNKSAFTI